MNKIMNCCFNKETLKFKFIKTIKLNSMLESTYLTKLLENFKSKLSKDKTLYKDLTKG